MYTKLWACIGPEKGWRELLREKRVCIRNELK
jgi:hypothetical protein